MKEAWLTGGTIKIIEKRHHSASLLCGFNLEEITRI
jgi:hypothetical protein